MIELRLLRKDSKLDSRSE